MTDEARTAGGNRKLRRLLVGIVIAAVAASIPMIVISCTTSAGGKTHVDAKTLTLRDGTFEGTSFKFPGKFAAEVTIEGGKIAGIRVTKQAALKKYTDILAPMIEDVIEKQSTEVDDITGATISCVALRKAVNDALLKAQAEGASR